MQYLISYLVTAITLLRVQPAFAQAQAPAPIVITPVIGFTSINQVASVLVSLVFFGGAILCFGYMILGGYKYITAQDNASQTGEARKTIQNAAIGLVLLGIIYVLFKLTVNLIPGLGQYFR